MHVAVMFIFTRHKIVRIDTQRDELAGHFNDDRMQLEDNILQLTFIIVKVVFKISVFYYTDR